MEAGHLRGPRPRGHCAVVGINGGGLDGSFALALGTLPEFQEMWMWRRLGKNGKDEPLTAEQELKAVGRRSKR